MKYTLYYTNEFGQNLDPSNDGVSGPGGDNTSGEVFYDLGEVKAVAARYVDRYPQNYCTIIPEGENAEAIVVSATDDKLQAVSQSRKKLLDQKLRSMRCRKSIVVCTLLMLLLVSGFLVYLKK